MIFGDRSDFAVEVHVDAGAEDRPGIISGRMCLWANDIALGDIKETNCWLNPVRDSLVELIDRLDDQWSDAFVGLDDIALWNVLDGLLYGYHGDVELLDERTTEECTRDGEIWGRFDFLTNWSELFDGYKAFLVCPSATGVVILARTPSGARHRLELTRDGLVRAVREFDLWFRAHLAGRRTSGCS
jgi:hypothetical protein